MRSLRLFDLRVNGHFELGGPLSVHCLGSGSLTLSEDATYTVLATAGACALRLGEDHYPLRREHYAIATGPGTLHGGSALVIAHAGYRGLRQLGGPLETSGRLRYVDGCTDTLLVCPPRLGEPCLNHLHIPPHTQQSEHTHPSLRLGVIARGSGLCRTPDAELALEEGMGFYLPPELVHSFVTRESALDVFAWHPDSDFGPTDRDHPMRNRTILR